MALRDDVVDCDGVRVSGSFERNGRSFLAWLIDERQNGPADRFRQIRPRGDDAGEVGVAGVCCSRCCSRMVGVCGSA